MRPKILGVERETLRDLRIVKGDDPPARKRVPLISLTDSMCHWPYGDWETGFKFCGRKSVDGKPYCAAHWKRRVRPQYTAARRQRSIAPWALNQSREFFEPNEQEEIDGGKIKGQKQPV